MRSPTEVEDDGDRSARMSDLGMISCCSEEVPQGLRQRLLWEYARRCELHALQVAEWPTWYAQCRAHQLRWN